MLAAPCCHHDIAAQLRKAPTPAPYAMLTRHGILRERLADTLTDALRATLMRLQRLPRRRRRSSSRASTRHATPCSARPAPARRSRAARVRREYDDLVTTWGIRPRLAELLDG